MTVAILKKPTEVDKQPVKSSNKFAVLQALADSILRRRDEAVEARAASGVERRWREDQALFDGLDPQLMRTDMIDYATQEAPLVDEGAPQRSRVIVNICRGKCETAEGRFADIMLPTDENNWGIKPTPDPTLADALEDHRPVMHTQTGQPLGIDGQPLQPGQEPLKMSDVARNEKKEAEKRAKKMEAEINDQLTECGFNGEERKMISYAVRLGTGILKGPNVVKTIKKVWMQKGAAGQEEQPEIQTGEHPLEFALEIVEELRPASKAINPWCVYPDPHCGENIKKANYIFERSEITPRELRNLLNVPGYFNTEIKKILNEEPIHTTTACKKEDGKFATKKDFYEKGSSYEKWEYYGDLNRDDLQALDIDIPPGDIPSISACVVFVNDHPIKVMLNPLDSGDLPYDFFQWTTVSGSPWGIGIPRMLQWQQRVITAAWRAMMDNAGDSAGANVIIGSGVQPVDGRWEITGKKLWQATGDIDDVRSAFIQFQLANNQPELENIIELALKFTDMETSIPMIFQGEQGKLPETLGATNIMVNSNNVALRTRVKRFDDQITRPHITRYYDWNMQYSDKDEIKGDLNVDVRGTSILLERDQQAHAIEQLLVLRQDPELSSLIDWKKALRQILSAQKLDILKPPEDQEALPSGQPVGQQGNTGQQQQVQQQAQAQQAEGQEKIATIKAESAMQLKELEQQGEQREIELKREQMISQLEAKQQLLEAQMQHEKEMKQMDYQIKMMELAAKRDMSIADIKAALARDAAKMNLQRELSDRDVVAKQVLTPPTEPAGRAKPGEAYQA